MNNLKIKIVTKQYSQKKFVKGSEIHFKMYKILSYHEKQTNYFYNVSLPDNFLSLTNS